MWPTTWSTPRSTLYVDEFCNMFSFQADFSAYQEELLLRDLKVTSESPKSRLGAAGWAWAPSDNETWRLGQWGALDWTMLCVPWWKLFFCVLPIHTGNKAQTKPPSVSPLIGIQTSCGWNRKISFIFKWKTSMKYSKYPENNIIGIHESSTQF